MIIQINQYCMFVLTFVIVAMYVCNYKPFYQNSSIHFSFYISTFIYIHVQYCICPQRYWYLYWSYRNLSIYFLHHYSLDICLFFEVFIILSKVIEVYRYYFDLIIVIIIILLAEIYRYAFQYTFLVDI